MYWATAEWLFGCACISSQGNPLNHLYLLFWADAHLNEVGFMNLDGGARHHIPAKRTSHISSMTVFDDHLFWSDWNLREVIRADKWTGQNETVLKTTTQLPSDIRVILHEMVFCYANCHATI
ncbi:unnamed protein product [Gongylonema pulchrum]|uniref:Neur_chan_LBD domain-containing protein n=2 Tax=Gongylonema pulchrum TaxID=637853 RepID=A0A183EG90_9BILA|nr:unnamed protein product [Gongylonema pulchrum]